MAKDIKVLLVDDEVDFTDTMSFWLESKGYSVLVNNDGESAVKTVKGSSPDIIFLDLNMPNMNGEETLKKIRAFDKELPVIIISAYIDDQKEMAEIRKLGISGVFYKGKDFKEGLELLEVALRSHKKLK
jgi:CheY-like chemotaxis protein